MEPFIILVIVLVFLLTVGVFSNRIEGFSSVMLPHELTMHEYIQEVRVLASYVGPYIGEIYSFLRVKYANPDKNLPMPPYYQPMADTDITLKDPLLPMARAQIVAWLDSANVKFVKRYGADFLAAAKQSYSLEYKVQTDDVLHVTMTEDGVSQTYIV